jgi:hypothetical protein
MDGKWWRWKLIQEAAGIRCRLRDRPAGAGRPRSRRKSGSQRTRRWSKRASNRWFLFLVGSLPAATGRKMRFTGATALRVEDGKIAEEVRLDDGVTALQQLGLLRTSSSAREGLEFSRVSIVGALQKSLRFHQNDPFLARGTDNAKHELPDSWIKRGYSRYDGI